MIDLRLGDCLEVMRDIPSGSVDAVVTDPPYGINYASSRKTRRDGSPRLTMPNFGEDRFDGRWLADVYRILKPNTTLYMFTRWDVVHKWQEALDEVGFRIAQRIVWDKTHWGMGDLRYYGSQTEDVLFCRKGAPNLNYPTRRGNIVRHNSLILPEGQYNHPTQKPLHIITQFVLDGSPHEATVLDPFMGSGTTGVACVNTGRSFIGIEKDAGYFQIAKERIRKAQEAGKQLEFTA